MAKRCNKTSLVGLSLSTLDDLLALTLACRYKNRKSIKRPPSCAPLCEKNNNLGDSAGLEHRKAWHYCCSPCRPLLIYWVNNKKRGEGETSDTKWPNAFSFLFFFRNKKKENKRRRNSVKHLTVGLDYKSQMFFFFFKENFFKNFCFLLASSLLGRSVYWASPPTGPPPSHSGRRLLLCHDATSLQFWADDEAQANATRPLPFN